MSVEPIDGRLDHWTATMNQDLTPRERETLSLITDAVLQRGYPPTLQEIADELGVTRPTVFAFLRRLEAKGRIERTPGSARAIRIIHA